MRIRSTASWLRTAPLLALLLVLTLLSAGCAAATGSPTPTPEADCLTLLSDEEINELYRSYEDLWPIEDCHAAYAAARSLTSGGHVRLTEITQIISVENVQRSLYQSDPEPAWKVELRGRMAFDSPLVPPMPSGTASPTQTPTGPVYGCMRVIVLARTSSYASVGSMECPPHPYLPSPTP